jgi:hypothetical protein
MVTPPHSTGPGEHPASIVPGTRRYSSVMSAWMSNSECPPKMKVTPLPGSAGRHPPHSVLAVESDTLVRQSPSGGGLNASPSDGSPPQAAVPEIGV